MSVTDIIQWFAIWWLLLKAWDTSIRLRRLEKRAAIWDRHPEGDETRSGSVERSEIEPGDGEAGNRPKGLA